jgi:hypothetical protein
MPDQPRWTEYVDVDAIVPDERNPKNHADDVLDESLERFGYTEQVMVDERTGKLVAGHGRRALVLRARAKGGEPPGTEDAMTGIECRGGFAAGMERTKQAYDGKVRKP